MMIEVRYYDNSKETQYICTELYMSNNIIKSPTRLYTYIINKIHIDKSTHNIILNGELFTSESLCVDIEHNFVLYIVPLKYIEFRKRILNRKHVMIKDINMLKLFIEFKPHVDTCNDLLYMLILDVEYNIEQIKILLDNIDNESRILNLHTCLITDNTEYVNLILDLEIDLTKDVRPYTCGILMNACSHYKILKTLFSMKIYRTDYYMYMAMCQCCRNNNIESLGILMKNGLDIHDEYHALSPFYIAYENNNREMVKFLLNLDVDTDNKKIRKTMGIIRKTIK